MGMEEASEVCNELRLPGPNVCFEEASEVCEECLLGPNMCARRKRVRF